MNITRAARATSATFLLAALVSGCGNMATISRLNEPSIEGHIVSSSREKLDLQVPGFDGPVSIDRKNVTDIDHPGNVAATIGGIVSVYGITNVIVGAPQCNTYNPAYCVGVFLPLAIGVPIFVYGLKTWSDSTSAAEPKGPATNANIAVMPIASLQKNHEVLGASVVVTH